MTPRRARVTMMERELAERGAKERLRLVFTLLPAEATCSMCYDRTTGGVRVALSGSQSFHVICARCVDCMRKAVAQ
jgi:hypothetical protein